MKTTLHRTLTLAAALAVLFCTANLPAAETNNLSPRIGVYDSRAVAYAWFWSAKHQTWLKQQMQTARAAKAAGDTNRFQELDTMLSGHQAEMHREVFSTAPPGEALAEITDRLPAIQKAAGVTALVSKWDDPALKTYPDAEQVDVTDTLVREFITPSPQQQKVISGMKTVAPLPLDKCNELIRKGEI